MDALPPWIDREAWEGFVEMRKAMKRIPFTGRAAMLVLKELYALKAAGHDPNVCLDQSTVNGWRDVFPPRHKDLKSASKGDDALLKIREDEKKAAPMPDKVRSMLVNVVKRMP